MWDPHVIYSNFVSSWLTSRSHHPYQTHGSHPPGRPVIHSEFVSSYWHLGPTVRPHRPDKWRRSDRGVPTNICGKIKAQAGVRTRNLPTQTWFPYHQAILNLVISPRAILVLIRSSRLVGPRPLWIVLGPLWTRGLGNVFFYFLSHKADCLVPPSNLERVRIAK
jgi:hypothetical protein